MESDSEYLKRLRNELGVSQKMLADYLGYSRNYIAVIETGKRPLSKHFIEQIAIVFSIERD